MRKTKSISVTSGKGGVGKTSFSINFSYELVNQGYKVLLVDCDFGLANIDIMLNLSVAHTLEEVLLGKVAMTDAIIEFKKGFDVLPASSGIPEIADMDVEKQKIFIKHIADIQDNYDFLIFDTGAGIHKSVLRISASADYVIVVTNPEPTTITDAYTIMKILRSNYKISAFKLVVNQSSIEAAMKVKKLLYSVAQENGVLYKLDLLGAIPRDSLVSNALNRRQLWHSLNSNAKCVVSLNDIAIALLGGDKENIQPQSNKFGFWKKWLLDP
ncbi:MAG: AAA family ATPase [SAR324 cluster bacterium]|nr:AAA family ATPase [SAR324 cluster bacterium]